MDVLPYINISNQLVNGIWQSMQPNKMYYRPNNNNDNDDDGDDGRDEIKEKVKMATRMHL